VNMGGKTGEGKGGEAGSIKSRDVLHAGISTKLYQLWGPGSTIELCEEKGQKGRTFNDPLVRSCVTVRSSRTPGKTGEIGIGIRRT